jgi:hypothetical protein
MTALFVALFVFGLDKHSSMVASVFVLIMALAITLAMRELQIQETEGKINVKNSRLF